MRNAALVLRSIIVAGLKGALRGKNAASELKIFRSIYFDRNAVNERHVDAHAVLKRAQMLELLAFLDGEGRNETNRSSAARRYAYMPKWW